MENDVSEQEMVECFLMMEKPGQRHFTARRQQDGRMLTFNMAGLRRIDDPRVPVPEDEPPKLLDGPVGLLAYHLPKARFVWGGKNVRVRLQMSEQAWEEAAPNMLSAFLVENPWVDVVTEHGHEYIKATWSVPKREEGAEARRISEQYERSW